MPMNDSNPVSPRRCSASLALLLAALGSSGYVACTGDDDSNTPGKGGASGTAGKGGTAGAGTAGSGAMAGAGTAGSGAMAVPECYSTAECPGGHECSAGICIGYLYCDDSSACRSNQDCLDSVCRVPCTQNAECEDEGLVCGNSQGDTRHCKPAANPPRP